MRMNVPLARLLAGAASAVLPAVTRVESDRVVLTSFHGRGYRGNPRALFEHLLETDRLDPIWLATDPAIVARVRAAHGPNRAHHVHSARGLRALASARAVVISHGTSDLPGVHIPRRALLIQSWHGLPTKRGELTADHVDWRTRFDVWRRFEPIDRFLSTSPYVSGLYGPRFGLPPERFLDLGYPAYDALSQADAPMLDSAAAFPDAPAHRRLIVYAPTFRKQTMTRFFPFDDLEDTALADFLEEVDALVCLRPHPNDRVDLGRWRAMSPRIVAGDHGGIEDSQALLRRADLVVTDYSGIFLEGLLAGAPPMFVPYDRDHYERGFPYDYDANTPGPKVVTAAAFFAEARALLEGTDVYADRRAAVRTRFFAHTDGRATERLADWLVAHLACTPDE